MPPTNKILRPSQDSGGADRDRFPKDKKPAPDMAKRTVTILVVDDEKPILKIVPRVLKKEGREFKAVDNAEEALELVRAGGIDLVVTDLVMPNMDGLQLLRAIKQEDSGNSPEVIIISGSLMEASVNAIRDAGAFGFVNKPFDTAELKVLVDYALAHLED